MSQPERMLTPWVSPLHTFGAEVRRRRVAAGLSQERLGVLTHHSAALIGRIEKAERRASLATTRILDRTLSANGALVSLWEAAFAYRIHTGPTLRMRPGVIEELADAQGLGDVEGVAEYAGLERVMVRMVAAGLRQPSATFIARFCTAFDLGLEQVFEVAPSLRPGDPPDDTPDEFAD